MWRMQAMESEVKINSLKKEIEDLKLEINAQTTTSQASFSDDVELNKKQDIQIVSSFKKQPMIEIENKENSVIVKKSVSFNADSPKPNVNFRRRCKTSSAPPTYL